MNMLKLRLALFVGIALAAAGHAFAEKPESPGGANPKKASQAQPGSTFAENTVGDVVYFNDNRRAILSEYYAGARASGHCPPGLAKKNNGCLPPGQAMKWRRGDHLPRDLVYYDLPTAVLAELGRTPEGAKVIQVGAALLLISAGTGLILDAMDIPQ
jgi:Ni/Co efflux regulator RcnB